jgi:hypothetical protein
MPSDIPPHKTTLKAPREAGCWRCDFGSGYRGMDRCHVCDGTGLTYEVAVTAAPDMAKTLRIFPRTDAGKAAAMEAANA